MLPLNTPVVFLDESGIEEHMQREYAWSKRGEKVTIFKPGKKFKRTNIIAAQLGKTVISPFQYAGQQIQNGLRFGLNGIFALTYLKKA